MVFKIASISCRSMFETSSGETTNRARSSAVKERGGTPGTAGPDGVVPESGAVAALPDRVPAAGPPAAGPLGAAPGPVD
eukprot:924758-Pleurochrysis_carterae.AAC.1